MKEKTLHLAGKIAKAVVYNRPLAILIFLASFALGLFGFLFTPKQYNPEITLPAFQVVVEYPGASVDEVEQFVTKELEEKIRDIVGVDEVYTYSMHGGAAIAQVIFKVGEDVEISKVKLQSKLSENSDIAEGNIHQPMIKSINPDDVPILTFGFAGVGMDQNHLRMQVFDIVSSLRNVEGIANIDVHGGEATALRVLLDTGAMSIRHVGFDDVVQAIQASNMRVRAGTLDDNVRQRVIEVDGTIQTKKQAEDILIIPGVTLGDIAHIEDGFQEKTSFVSVDTPAQEDQAVVFLSVAKRKGENAIELAARVDSFLKSELQKEQYAHISYEVYRDEAAVAAESISGLSINLITSIAIVFMVLLLFLGGRSAVTVAIAIPLTLSWVFFIGYLFGETINRITLFALILSLGLLVDSATVVVENIYRHLQEGYAKKEAIIYGVDEVGMGLFLSTLTSVIVFLPTSKISGMMGEYMGPLSFFVPMALLVSLGVAYVLTPFISDIVLKEPKKGTQTKTKVAQALDRVAEKYAVWLGKVLDSRKKQFQFLGKIFILFLIVMVFPLIELVHFRMLPSADKEQYYVYIDAPNGTDVETTQLIVDDIADVLLADSETVSIQRFVGTPPIVDFNGLFKGADLRGESHMATLRVNITDKASRRISSEDLVVRVRESFEQNEHIATYLRLGTSIKFIEDPPGPPLQATFVAKVKGTDESVRQDMLAMLMPEILATKGVVDVDTSQEELVVRTLLSVDHEKAMSTGVSAAHIAQALRTSITGIELSQYHKQGQKELSFIELQVPKEKRMTLEHLQDISIKNIAGESVPLLSVVKKVDTANPAVLIRDEGQATSYVTAEMEKRSIVYVMKDIIFFLLGNKEQLPEGMTLNKWNLFEFVYVDAVGDEYTIEWGGEWKMTLENFRDLGLAMMVAFVLIYAVLVAQFKTFSAPVKIMTTIPLGFIGILPGFALLDVTFGTFLTATTLIGFIALMGIVVNNAILLLEYIQQLQAEGVSLRNALIESGKTRLRPILLTSMTTVLGSLTIVGDPVWSGLAWSIVFGLSLSALLTLGVFPVLLYLGEKK
ncbi:efflux RND transporter permease subunit [Patescibacteria group bacterium]|nr:efflux RND transporter permease subunit [Patescibacteria group bacterium]MBU1721501.1 efflux RND transporter permease subunit [Patescibacteria group bacterium]